MSTIHPTAILGENVLLGENVVVGAYAIIEGGAQIGDGCVIEPHARVCGWARIAENCKIGSFAVVGGEPQDLHFDSSVPSYVEIGAGSVIRESATVHRATFAESATKIGKCALMMASSHVGHDCVVGDNYIAGCFSALAGHVHAGKDVFVSGGVMIHQRVRIGDGVIVSGNSASSMDIPPYTIAHSRNSLSGLNLIGMTRRKMPRAEIAEVKSLYAGVYANPSARKNALALIESGAAKTPAGENFLNFFAAEGRHYLSPFTGREK